MELQLTMTGMKLLIELQPSKKVDLHWDVCLFDHSGTFVNEFTVPLSILENIPHPITPKSTYIG